MDGATIGVLVGGILGLTLGIIAGHYRKKPGEPVPAPERTESPRRCSGGSHDGDPCSRQEGHDGACHVERRRFLPRCGWARYGVVCPESRIVLCDLRDGHPGRHVSFLDDGTRVEWSLPRTIVLDTLGGAGAEEGTPPDADPVAPKAETNGPCGTAHCPVCDALGLAGRPHEGGSHDGAVSYSLSGDHSPPAESKET